MKTLLFAAVLFIAVQDTVQLDTIVINDYGEHLILQQQKIDNDLDSIRTDIKMLIKQLEEKRNE